MTDWDDPLFDEAISRILVERVGTSKDVADLVWFLLSDKAGYITGQDLILDGGYSAW